MSHIRHSFEEQLRDLQEDVVRMASLAAEAVRTAVQCLERHDASQVPQVLQVENQIDALNLSIENHCLQLLAMQQPMARDLRTISSAMRIITDIERIGDYSVDIANQAKVLCAAPPFRPLEDIPRIAEIVQRMLHDAMQAFTTRDLDLALAAVQRDDEVDHAYHALHDELAEYITRNPVMAPLAIRLALVGFFLERMADHITNIGERIFYIETGELKELHE